MNLFQGRDEKSKIVTNNAIKYTYGFIIILSVVLLIIQLLFKKVTLLSPIHLFGSYYMTIYISAKIGNILGILIITQAFISIVARHIMNGHSSSYKSKSKPGPADAKKMRIIMDKCVAISFLYIIIFLIVWIVMDITINKIMGLPVVIFVLSIIFYNLKKEK